MGWSIERWVAGESGGEKVVHSRLWFASRMSVPFCLSASVECLCLRVACTASIGVLACTTVLAARFYCDRVTWQTRTNLAGKLSTNEREWQARWRRARGRAPSSGHITKH